MTNGERRRKERFRMQLSCRVSFRFPMSGEFDGVTRDISRSGLAVRLVAGTSNGPEIGTTARILVNLPQGPHFHQQFLNCTADVVRVEDGNSSERMVAFRVRRIRFGKRELRRGELANSTIAMPRAEFLQ